MKKYIKPFLQVLTTIVVLIVIMMLFSKTTTGGGSSASSSSDNKKIEAYIVAKNKVTAGLKAPSTAIFSSYNESIVQDLGNDEFKVVGHVDSQNSFGAMIRSQFIIVLKREGEYKFTATSLVYDGEKLI